MAACRQGSPSGSGGAARRRAITALVVAVACLAATSAPVVRADFPVWMEPEYIGTVTVQGFTLAIEATLTQPDAIQLLVFGTHLQATMSLNETDFTINLTWQTSLSFAGIEAGDNVHGIYERVGPQFRMLLPVPPAEAPRTSWTSTSPRAC